MLQMAKDDFDVIVFKILSYLYSCLKNGARVDGARQMVPFGIT